MYNIVELPPEGYDLLPKGCSAPAFKSLNYYSRTAGRQTPVNVLLPEDYSESKKYPVLYMLHGFFDNQGWFTRPEVRLPEIYTTLRRTGKAREMMIVLPYIFCSKELPACTGMNLESCLAYDNFINDLTTDLMPFINSSFSTDTSREKTAITGFSMGGREALFIGFKHPELFGYVGAACPAPGLVEIADSPMHPGQISADEMRFGEYKPHALLISSSKADCVVADAPDTYRQILRANRVPFLSHVMQQTLHDHTAVKPHLYNYLQIVFN